MGGTFLFLPPKLYRSHLRHLRIRHHMFPGLIIGLGWLLEEISHWSWSRYLYDLVPIPILHILPDCLYLFVCGCLA